MLYFIGAAMALWAVALLLVAGSAGYAIARLPKMRWIVLMISGVFVLVFGLMGLVLGSAAYTGLTRSTTRASLTTPPVVADNNPLPATDAWLHFQSDSGDYIGGGEPRLYAVMQSDGFTIRSTKQQIQVNLQGDGDYWNLWFRAPSGGDLHAGVFNHAERAPFASTGSPGLDISGAGRGCNTLSGRFDILRLTWSSYGDVAAFDVLFEQHCEGNRPALYGELWIATQQGAHKPPPDVGAPVARF